MTVSPMEKAKQQWIDALVEAATLQRQNTPSDSLKRGVYLQSLTSANGMLGLRHAAWKRIEQEAREAQGLYYEVSHHKPVDVRKQGEALTTLARLVGCEIDEATVMTKLLVLFKPPKIFGRYIDENIIG